VTSEGVIPQALHAWVDPAIGRRHGEYILAAAT
jgi:hypothetical protein